MSKALIITSVASMVDQFLLPNLFLLQDMGYEIHVACNFEKGSTCSEEKIQNLKRTLTEKNIKFYQIDFERDVTHIFGHVMAYRQLSAIVKSNAFDLIHCHSPIGGMLGRLVARKQRKKGAKVFYTAHGFHFYKGAPLKNWLIYYPVEKFCSRFTDVLITMNKEDYSLAKRKMRAKRIEYVPGVGINLSRFENVSIDRAQKRRELGVPENAVIFISVGELIDRKNHTVVLQALSQIKNDNIHYVVVGKGQLQQQLQDNANDLGIADTVHLLGFRKDVPELYKAADVCCFPSIHEGLPVALMEAMACRLPVVCSSIRGNVDLIDSNGGILFDKHSVTECRDAIEKILTVDVAGMGSRNSEYVQQFSTERVLAVMKSIYES